MNICEGSTAIFRYLAASGLLAACEVRVLEVLGHEARVLHLNKANEGDVEVVDVDSLSAAI